MANIQCNIKLIFRGEIWCQILGPKRAWTGSFLFICVFFYFWVFFSSSFFPIILWSNSDGPGRTWLLCFIFWQSNFIKLFDGGLQYKVIQTFFLSLRRLVMKEDFRLTLKWNCNFGTTIDFPEFLLKEIHPPHYYLHMLPHGLVV